MLIGQEKLDEALDAYRSGLAVMERLTKSEPGNLGWQRELAVVIGMVGAILAQQDKTAEALATYEQGLAVTEQLAKSDPGNAVWQRDLVVADNKVGIELMALGKPEEALMRFSAGFAIAERLAQADPGNAAARRDLSTSYTWIGIAQAALGRLTEASTSYEAALGIAVALAKSDPGNADWRNDLGLIVEKIGDNAYYLLLAGHFAESLKMSELAIAAGPGEIIWLDTNRAHALMLIGRLDEARAIYLKHRGERMPNDKEWETAIRDDFAELRGKGLTSPLMDEIETAFAGK